jgi:hypothetical protein
MTGPFRDQHVTCPACQLVMRPFGERFVCDTCTRMQLSDGDFQREIEAVDLRATKLHWATGNPGHACPQCQHTMTHDRLRVVFDQTVVDARVITERCSHHGPWISTKDLAALFVAIERIVLPAGYGRGKPFNGDI